MDTPATPDKPVRERLQELVAFLLLTGILAPGIAVGAVGGFGFVVWMFQILIGPSGPLNGDTHGGRRLRLVGP